MTPTLFAEITTALARTLDPAHLAAAVTALAPMIEDTDFVANSDADAKPKLRRPTKPREHTVAFNRACDVFRGDPAASIGAAMSGAHCSSSIAIMARRKVRGEEEISAEPVPSEPDATPSSPSVPEPNNDKSPEPESAKVEILPPGPAPPTTALGKAKNFIQGYLKPGPRTEDSIRAAAFVARISTAVLDRAAEELDIVRFYPAGTNHPPTWRLPGR